MLYRLFQTGQISEMPFPVSKTLLDDLELAVFLGRFFDNPAQFITCDAEAIKERNEVCMAMMGNEILTASLQKLYGASLPMLDTAQSFHSEPIQVVHNMNGVRLFRDAAFAAVKTIKNCKNLPPTLAALPDKLNELLEKRYPNNFDDAWEKYAGGVEKTGSMSFFIHFTEHLSIDAIAISGVHRQRYVEYSLLDRLRGVSKAKHVHSLLSLNPDHHSEESRLIDPHRTTTSLQMFSRSVRDMLQTQTAASKSHVAAMERHIAGDIKVLVEELRFVLGMVECVKAMSALSKLCYATIRNMDERMLVVNGMAHPALAEQTDVVVNDISIQNHRELVLLGGANRGGKTTYLRTVGAMQVLFQMGLPIPAAAAEISPATGIFSVFSHEETTELSQGKLGQELSEIRDVIATLDDNSLFFGNEPISGTSPAESYLLSREALCMLKAKHARGIWVTHLYKMFDDVDNLNEIDIGSKIICMHADTAGDKQSFVILPGMPKKYSGAKEVFYRSDS